MSIRAESLSFQYDGRPGVQDITLNIREGTLTVLCGVTGSGKSTLLRLLAGLETPSSGRIIHENAGEADRKNTVAMSMVFQQPETQLFAGSIYKDMEYGLEQRGVPKARRTEMIRSALTRVGLSYDEFAGRSPFLLSGGEKRRVCIAGALASQPGLLILDEPTAGLDPPAAQSLLNLVQELRTDGLTLIIGTHDLDSFLPIADEVIVMKQGSVHYDGPASALTADPALLSAAGLIPPAYASIGQTLLNRGLLKSMPDSLEQLLAGLDRLPLPVPPADCHQPGSGVGTAQLSRQLKSGDEERDPADHGQTAAAGTHSAPGKTGSGHHETAPGRLRWQGLDPRAKWLGMILGSLAVLGMDALLPLLLTAGLLAGLVSSAGISWRRTFRFFRPFLLMFLFLWLLSALSWSSPDYTIGPFGFSAAGIQRGGISVLRFLLLIVLGFLFTETTTGAPLREGLEWAIAPLKTLGIRTRNWSLAVSVTLQFVPWILGKLAQLQLALGSRGRRARGLARWSPRQIVLIIVPLLILVLEMGDELSTAIESRGYDPAKQRTPVYQLNWSTRDTLAALCILTAVALLWWVSRIS
jgi:energy-coupling factor transport system ATP-binding protein